MRLPSVGSLFALALGVTCLAAGAGRAGAQKAGPAKVTLARSGDAWQLAVDGKPFVIKGAGGSGSLEKLKAAGANAVRTWGADNLDAMLDQADRLGIKVAVGIWLGQERQGFSYNSADMVAQQAETVRKAVLRYKDHPAVLLWGLGNEMEGYEKGDNAAIWSAINNLAAMVKRIDPNHPTMTVVAEIGGDRVKNINRLCPDIDIVGINSYGGGLSIPTRYKQAGGVKPYVLAEFGPAGTWEGPKTAWGAPIELTSTEKAAAYRRTWDQAIANQPLALGGFAFTWGNKQEATATWFGMLLPDGSKLGAVDAMTEAWTGKPPADRSPVIKSLKLEGADQVDPGATVKAALDASDPDGDPIDVKWVLQPEADRVGVGGDAEATLPTYPGAIVKADARGAEVKVPSDPGGYRLFAYVRDGKGSAAVGNVPFLARGTVKVAGGAAAKLPLVIYDEQGRANPPYVPTGWMGNTKAGKLDEACTVNPHSGKTCLRFDFTAQNDWIGVVYQSPANDWGDLPGGWNLTGAKRLVFWARGEKGGEPVTFQFGLLARDKRYFDTAQGKIENPGLTKEWREYSLDVSGKDLTRVKTGFCWVVAAKAEPVTIYLDDIRFE